LAKRGATFQPKPYGLTTGRREYLSFGTAFLVDPYIRERSRFPNLTVHPKGAIFTVEE
jgi:hypothetical protein